MTYDTLPRCAVPLQPPVFLDCAFCGDEIKGGKGECTEAGLMHPNCKAFWSEEAERFTKRGLGLAFLAWTLALIFGAAFIKAGLHFTAGR